VIGRQGELLWLTHIGTCIGGIGAILRNKLLISTALVALLESHALWILDILFRLISGTYLIGVASYLENESIGGFIQSSNHLFTVPFMAVLAFILRGINRRAWIIAGLLFALLVLLSRLATDPALNVNSSHRMWTGLDKTFFGSFDTFSTPIYLAAIILVNTFGNFLPVAFISDKIYSVLRTHEKSS
jgi:hypothetical protein